MLADWPTRKQAEGLRQWPIFVHLAEQVARIDALDGLMLLGSFAAGTADDVSDVDFVAVVARGRFREAWEQRVSLDTPGALCSWDVRDEAQLDQGARKWITRDVVKVECAIVDGPPRGNMELAEPFAVIVGDSTIADRFPRIGPISPEILEAYAEKLRSQGKSPEVESRYGDLKRAIRAARSKQG